MALSPLGFDSLSGLGFQVPRVARQFQPPDLSEEEKQGLLSSVLGGLQYAGETLDKPGAAVRGLLAGRPDQLLNLIPFSDTLGITDPSKRTEGRDLLEQYGLAPKNVPGLFNSPTDAFWDVAGFGTAVALDPLTLISGPGKALTSLGRAAERGTLRATTRTAKQAAKATGEVVGSLKKSLATYVGEEGAETFGRRLGSTPTETVKEIREGLRGVLGIGLTPWSDPFITFGAKSEMAAKAVEKVYGNRVVAFARGVFSPTVDGLYDPVAQRAKDMQVAKMIRLEDDFANLYPAVKQSAQTLPRLFNDLVKHHAGMGDEVSANMFRDLARDLAETPLFDAAGESRKLNPGDVQAAMKSLGDNGALVDEWATVSEGFSNQMYEYIDTMVTTKDLMADRARDLGVPLAHLDDMFANHMARRPSNKEVLYRIKKGGNKKPQPDDDARLFAVGTDYAKGRGSVFRHFPGRTSGFDQAVRDRVLRGLIDPVDVENLNQVVPLTGATAGKLVPGSVVRASDRMNFGRVIQAGPKTAEVHFVSKEGVEATKTFQLGQLTKMSADTKGRVPMLKMPKDKHVALLRRELGLADDVAVGATREELQSMYLMKKRIEPKLAGAQLRKPVAPGVDNPIDNELEWWRNGLDEETAKAMKRQAGRPQADVVVDYINKLPSDTVHTGLFDRDMVTDWHDYMESMFSAMSTMSSAHSFLHGKDMVRHLPGGVADLKDTDNLIPLREAWGDAKLSEQGYAKFVDDFVKKSEKMKPEDQAKLLESPTEQLWVEPRVAKTLTAYAESTQPKVTNKLLEVGDKITALYKGSLTTPWPSFHARNGVSGIWSAWAEGDVSIGELASAWLDGIKHAKKPDAGHMRFMDEAVDQGVFGKNMSRQVDAAGEGAGSGAIPTEGLFSGIYKAVTDPVKWVPGVRRQNVNLFNTRGAYTRELVDAAGNVLLDAAGSPRLHQNVLAEAGEQAYKYVEYLNRGPYYEALRRKGFSPAQAAHKVVRSQFDYSDLSSFEKSVARRVVPFYTWSRKNIPYTLSKLINRPGGRTAQTVRALNQGSSGDEYTPRFLREGVSVRMGGDERATSFLKGSGIPVEDLNKFIFGGQYSLPSGRTVDKLLSMTHPLGVAALEMQTGKNLFFGRDTKDLKGPLSDLVEEFAPAQSGTLRSVANMLDFGLMKSPFSRFANEARGVTDSRKPFWMRILNAGTGVKIGTYDLKKHESIELGKALGELLDKYPGIRSTQITYMPKEVMANYSPEEQSTITEIQKLQRALREQTKALAADSPR